MKPIELTIEGLYSYQERQTIDFNMLTSSNLFGIFGPVGSGKSSILEAITFAIYGRTDRLNLSGDNRYYNMMNLRSNEMLIDFIFEAGSEQTLYRATVKSSRNRRNFDDVRTPERSAYKSKNNEWIPISVEELEQSVGLNYDNFKRTIIIPQGQFQEFLQLGNRDRTRMMKELFNLEKYEFYYKVVSLEKKNDEQRQNIQGQLQQLGLINPDQVKEHEMQLQELKKKITDLNIHLQSQQKKEEDLRKLQELTQKRDEVSAQLKLLKEQEKSFESLEKEITRYENGVIHFKHLLDSLHSTQKKKRQREEQIHDELNKVKNETTEIERLEKLIEKIKPQYEQRATLKKKAEELGRILNLKTIEERIKKETSRVEKGTEILKGTMLGLEKLKENKLEQEEKIRDLRQQMPDLSLLSTVKAWHLENRNKQHQLKELEKEVQKLYQQKAVLQEEKTGLLSELHFDKLSLDDEYKTWYKLLEGEKVRVTEEQDQLIEHENHLRVKAQLKAYADDLQENTPCPLCGSVHHPERFTGEEIDDEIEKLAIQKKSWQKQLQHIARLEKELALLESREHQLELQLNEYKLKIKEQQNTVEAHEKLFSWNSYREESLIDKAFALAKDIEKELKTVENALQESIKQLENEERKKERFQEELHKIKTSLVVYQTELNTISQQFTLVLPETFQQTHPHLIEQEINQLLQEHDTIEEMHQKYSEQIQVHRMQKDRLEGGLERNRKELEEDKKAVETLLQQLNDRLNTSQFQTLDEVMELLSKPIDTELEKRKIAHFKEQLLRIKSSHEQITNEIGDRVYDPDAYKSLLSEIESNKNEIDQMNREQGKITQLLVKLQKDIESRTRLQKIIEGLDERAENIRTMKSLFKASGFVNYISSVYLQNLCNAANDRFFKLTRQQLSLEITEDNNFQVRDFLNGGKVRSVKTLSGGQTFQASLSLALALADNIQQITQSNQNFFFLDEGFGSLDRESLNIVFDTLKSLRKENRIVGVISHVEEMQQEIDTHLRVENDPDRGTLIHRSWEV